MPPLRRRICHAIQDPEALRRMPDSRIRGKAEKGQWAPESPQGGPAPVSAEGEL